MADIEKLAGTKSCSSANAAKAAPKFAWWGWGFVALSCYLTVIAAWNTRSVLATLLGALATVLCAPAFRRWVWSRTRLRLAAAPVAIVCTVLLASMATVGGEAQVKRQAALQEEAERKSAERVAKARADLLAYFEINKATVLRSVSDLLQAGKAEEALAELRRYATVSKDPDLIRAKSLAELQQAKDELANEDSLPLPRKAELYKRLAEAEPNNVAWLDRARMYGEELERQRQADAEARQLAAALTVREASIKKQFSGWDGSHPAVERAVKATMKNPNSYEHVETRFKDTGKALIVYTTIRGTNSFGGVVPSTFAATVDDSGNVVSISEVR